MTSIDNRLNIQLEDDLASIDLSGLERAGEINLYFLGALTEVNAS